MRTLSVFLLAGIQVCAAAPQISREDQTPRIDVNERGRFLDRLTFPYRAKTVAPVDFQNSGRIEKLIRGGQLYLSLQDAIALALENNLDIELQRFGPRIAESDTLRAKGGGLLRGIPLTLRELPAGVGGPGSPLLTTVGGITPITSVPTNSADLATITGQSSDLSILSTFPLATGPRIPAYDPAIVGQLNWSHQSTPQTSSFVTGTNSLIGNTLLGNLGLQQGFASGTAFNLGFNSNRLDQNATRPDYNPYTSANLGLTVTQPLLQGFGFAVNRRFIRIAANNERITDYVFRQQLIDTLSSVIRLYWDLVSLNEDVRVKRESLALAQKLFEDNQSQVEVGTLAAIEVKRARAEVARSRQDVINSEGLVEQQELILKNVLTRRGGSDPLVATARIVPLDRIQLPEREPVQPVQDLVAEAFRNRPDLTQARIQIDNSEISLKGSKNGLLPELDLIGSLQNNSLSGQPSTVQPSTANGTPFARTADPFYVGGFGNALSQIFSRNFPNYGIGLQLTIPLRNRVAQADVIRDELQLRQTQVRLQQLENQVKLEVGNALLVLQRARAGYDAAVETRQLQEEALDAERQRFGVGASTTFLVIQYQRDLAQARSTEVASQGTYAKARAALERSTGLTLRNNNVSVEEAYRGQVSRAPGAIPVQP
ncbi:MAG: TolC family protein [Acidobacteriota bacterium]|nr:TolC family protein [Acidobacteriota bacterium]